MNGILAGRQTTEDRAASVSQWQSNCGEPTVIWKSAKKEFLLNLMTFKFALRATICFVLTVLFMPV